MRLGKNSDDKINKCKIIVKLLMTKSFKNTGYKRECILSKKRKKKERECIISS